MAVISKSSGYRYVRRVKQKFQARIPVGDSHLNLGLWSDEWLAWRAAKNFLNRGELPPHVLPKYVRRLAAGTFTARVRIRGRLFAVGAFADPLEAQRALVEVLKEAYPDGPPRRSKRCWRKGPNFGRTVDC